MTPAPLTLDEFPTRTSKPSPECAVAVRSFAVGAPVVIGHGDSCVVALRADTASASALSILVRHGCGLIFVATTQDRLRELEVPALPTDGDSLCPNSYVAVDAADGIGTGISARDRAETIRRLGDPHSTARDFRRPGHVLPVAADLKVGAVPGAPQVLLMLTELAESPEAAAYTAMMSVDQHCELAPPAEGAVIAGRLQLPYVESRALTKAYYNR